MPIKRHLSLQPLSRDHHDGLLLSWKIGRGISMNIEPERMAKYVEWFYKEHLMPHFLLEEEHLFKLLPQENESVKKALAEHVELVSLFTKQEKNVEDLKLIAAKLESHIRFEERVLFNEIQAAVSEEELSKVELFNSTGSYCENPEDEFWVLKR